MSRTLKCRVSIIVPVYRVEGYLDRCIRSLLKQTLVEIEIICICEIEDPSYRKLIAYRMADARVRIIEKKNTSAAAARNAGIRAAKGEYVAFVDADDWIEQHTLEFLYDTASKHSAQITVYGLWPSREPGRDGRWVFRYTPNRNVIYRDHGMEALFYEIGSRPCAANKFYNRDFLLDNGLSFKESLDIGEDQFLQFEAFEQAETICFIKERLYHYEIGRPASAMNRCKKQQNLQEKNFHLLQRILSDKQVQDRYEKGYVWWILLDYGWIVNQKDVRVNERRKAQILSIQAELKKLSAEKYIEDLPKDFQQICQRFLDYRGEKQIGSYLYLPYGEFDDCMRKETIGLCEPLMLPRKNCRYIRRIYEMMIFHEVSHLIMEILVRFARQYRKIRAGKNL